MYHVMFSQRPEEPADDTQLVGQREQPANTGRHWFAMQIGREDKRRRRLRGAYENRAYPQHVSLGPVVSLATS